MLKLFANSLVDSSDHLPSFSIDIAGTTFGIFLPSVTFWIQLLTTLLIQQLFTTVIAGIVYHFIIPDRGSTKAYLTGFGIVCPLCLTCPLWIIQFLGIRNLLLRFTICAILPITSMFHCTEAMFNFSPHSVETSFKRYVLYYICAVEINFDEKTNKVVKASWYDILSKSKSFLRNILITGAYFSFMRHVQYQPFDNHINANALSFSIFELFSGVSDWKLILNNFTATILIHCYLSTFTSALCLLVSGVFGVKTCVAMDNPMLLSSSPSDFWGNRWNLLVHGCLKRGVFKPVRKYSTKSVAVWSTFVASGLFHEYLTFGICPTCPPNFGKQTVFFIWNAIIVTLEHFIGKAFIFQWIYTTMPKPVVGILVLFTAMPVAHWFLHAYTKTSLLDHSSAAFPIVMSMNDKGVTG